MSATFREVTDYLETDTRVFACYQDGLCLGWLCADTVHNTVELVYVPDFVRRKGVASKLLEFARAETGKTLEFDTGLRTLDGSRWCRAEGIKILPGNLYQRIGKRHIARQIARIGFALMYEPGVTE